MKSVLQGVHEDYGGMVVSFEVWHIMCQSWSMWRYQEPRWGGNDSLDQCKVKSPGGAVMIVRSLQTEEPRWGCNNNNNSEIVATSISVLNKPKSQVSVAVIWAEHIWIVCKQQAGSWGVRNSILCSHVEWCENANQPGKYFGVLPISLKVTKVHCEKTYK